MTYDEDNYWLDCIRKSGSNSVTSGYQDIVDFIASGKADDKTLSGMFAVFRSLSHECHRQLSERREKQRLARFHG